MTRRRPGVWLQTLSRFWLTLSLVVCPPVLAQEVIVNPSVAERTISPNTLRAIFSMRARQWPDGNPVKVFVLPDDNAVHIAFAKGVLNTFPHQLRRSWDLLVYSGSGQAPSVVDSPTEMLQKVSSTPGAIGYLPEDYLKEGGKKNGNVLILQIR